MPTAIYLELLGAIRGKGLTQGKERKVVGKAIEYLEQFDFLFVELDEYVAEIASGYISSFHLTGIDASILASASIYEARHLCTTDTQLLNVGDKVPGVSVERPSYPSTIL
ncbi:type II toxin-antitoxin system VapC family toxin [Corynebacterium flavescens]|nr:type II toxin-antitoxin system VapC family toxin [Corynebacterium flavescens]